MHKTGSTRISIAALVALCLLFSQIASAAYVCPQWLKVSGSMVDCDSMPVVVMDMEQPGLCKVHCASVQASYDSQGNADHLLSVFPVFPTLDGLWSLVGMLQPVSASIVLAPAAGTSSGQPPGSPPLYLVHNVFRL